MKTTAQKKYLVSPSNGILTAGETAKVSILRQARHVPAEKEDRFMVLGCATNSAEKLSMEEWTAQSNVEDIRLKVVLIGSEVKRMGGAMPLLECNPAHEIPFTPDMLNGARIIKDEGNALVSRAWR